MNWGLGPWKPMNWYFVEGAIEKIWPRVRKVFKLASLSRGFQFELETRGSSDSRGSDER
jgi:hypothetical protein